MSVTTFLLEKYNRIPQWIPGIIAPFFYLIPSQYRYGKTYRNEIRELERISHLSDEEIYAEKQDSLRKLIAYSYKHVPYYHRLFDTLGISPTEIFDESDLIKIPFLTKEDLVNNCDELVSDEFSEKDLVYITTSGSTGTPVGFFVQNDSAIRDFAYGNYLFRKFGFDENSSKLVLRGKIFYSQNKGKNYQWDPFKKELSINLFEMDDDSMESYCIAIERFKPDFAFGYMSAMYLLCKYFEKRTIGLRHKFKGFFAMSEKVIPEQREYVERIIGAPVFSTYGMSERVIYGAENEEPGFYQIQQLYGIAEIISSDGCTIKEPGIKGEIVGTSLLNYGMPLIRYKTGDISEWYDKEHKCLKGIEGRWKHDVLFSKSLFPITMTALNMHSDVFKSIYRYQLRQSEIGKVEILIVPGNGYTENVRKEIEKQFNNKTNGEIVFTAIEVAEIKPGKNGKVKMVEQMIDIDKIGC